MNLAAVNKNEGNHPLLSLQWMNLKVPHQDISDQQRSALTRFSTLEAIWPSVRPLVCCERKKRRQHCDICLKPNQRYFHSSRLHPQSIIQLVCLFPVTFHMNVSRRSLRSHLFDDRPPGCQTTRVALICPQSGAGHTSCKSVTVGMETWRSTIKCLIKRLRNVLIFIQLYAHSCWIEHIPLQFVVEIIQTNYENYLSSTSFYMFSPFVTSLIFHPFLFLLNWHSVIQQPISHPVLNLCPHICDPSRQTQDLVGFNQN